VKGAVEIFIEMNCVFVTIFTAKRGLVVYGKRTSVYATVCNAVVDSLLKKTDDPLLKPLSPHFYNRFEQRLKIYG
jgi:hypothetical protein